MEPRPTSRLAEDIDTLEDSSGGSGIGTATSGDGGNGASVQDSIANSKQVAEVSFGFVPSVSTLIEKFVVSSEAGWRCVLGGQLSGVKCGMNGLDLSKHG